MADLLWVLSLYLTTTTLILSMPNTLGSIPVGNLPEGICDTLDNKAIALSTDWLISLEPKQADVSSTNNASYSCEKMN